MEILSVLVGLTLSGLSIRGGVGDSIPCNDLLGQEIAPELIDTISARVLSQMAGAGFPLASVRLVAVDERNDSGFCEFLVEPGPLVIIRDVDLTTGKASAALRRVLGQVMGFPYSPTRVEGALDRAESFGFGRMRVVGLARGEKGFVMRLSPGGTNGLSAVGIGSYDPRTGQFFGYLSASGTNIAGTGRKASLSWERLSLLSQKVSGSYREPWIFSGPVWLELGGGYAFAESLYLSWEAFYRAIYPFSGETEVYLGQSYRFDQDIGQGTERSGLFFLAGGVWSAARPRIFPQRGFSVGTDWRLSESSQRGVVQAGAWLSRGFVFAGLSARAGLLFSDSALVTDLFPIGGHLPPRGYAPERFFLRDYMVLSGEIGNAGPASLFGFLDYCPSRALPSSWSSGAGLRLRGSRLGLELVYARSGAPGESGVLHISILGEY